MAIKFLIYEFQLKTTFLERRMSVNLALIKFYGEFFVSERTAQGSYCLPDIVCQSKNVNREDELNDELKKRGGSKTT